MTLTNPKYAQLAQHEFYEELFYGNSEQEKSAIAHEVIRLLDLLPDRFRSTFQETARLRKLAGNLSDTEPCSLTKIHSALIDKKLIRHLDIAAFITAELTLTSYDKLKFDQYKGLALIVIMELSFSGEHRSKIVELCNELRQYAAGRRESVIPYLPILIEESFPSLIEYFEEITDDENIDTSIRGKLNYYKKPIRDSFEHKQGIHRKSGNRGFKKEGNITLQTHQQLDDLPQVTIIEVDQRHHTEQPWQSEDSKFSDRTLSLISSPNFINRDPQTNALQARAINKRIQKKEMGLSCEISHITTSDIAFIMHDCYLDIKEQTDKREHAIIILLMIYSGNDFETIKAWKIAKSPRNGELSGVARKLSLPSQNIREEIECIVQSVTELYSLPFPKKIIHQLKSFRFKHINIEALKEYYLSIKKRHELTANFSALSKFLTQTLKSHQIDNTIIELIRGASPQNNPQNYYTFIRNGQLLEAYARYCNFLARLSRLQGDLNELSEVKPSGNLGSPLFIEPAIIKRAIELTSSAINSISRKNPGYFSSKIHNLRVLKLQIILGLSSGYRPVNGWFGVLSDIHIRTGEYRIAEKEREVGYRGRVITLPPIAIDELNGYISYCKQAEIYFVENNLIAQRFSDAISSQSSFCFYIDHGKIAECTPSQYAVYADKLLPLQPNWTRHYLRSLLFANNVNDELIDAWMGHLHDGQLPYERYSHLSRQAMSEICNLLQTHLQYLCGGNNA